MAPPFLTALLLLLLASPAAAAPGGKCLACHAPHPLPRGTVLPERLPPPDRACVRCHRGDDRTTRKDLAHGGFLPAAVARYRVKGDGETGRGKGILARSGCRRCHVSGGEGVMLAADLDLSSASRPPGETERSIRVPAAAMPDFRFGGEDRRALLKALLSNGIGRGDGKEGPRVVHFSKGAGERETHPFAVRCGPCHRALTERLGLLGTGTAGPDLSSLFTPYHPGRGRDGMRWDEATIPAWVENPRSLRPGALMPAGRATKAEAGEAGGILRVGSERLLPPTGAVPAGGKRDP